MRLLYVSLMVAAAFLRSGEALSTISDSIETTINIEASPSELNQRLLRTNAPDERGVTQEQSVDSCQSSIRSNATNHPQLAGVTDAILFVNVYVPNNRHERELLFRRMQRWALPIAEVILSGNFNCVSSPHGKLPTRWLCLLQLTNEPYVYALCDDSARNQSIDKIGIS